MGKKGKQMKLEKSILTKVMQEMLGLVVINVKHYTGDLIHDIEFLIKNKENLSANLVFLTRESGTGLFQVGTQDLGLEYYLEADRDDYRWFLIDIEGLSKFLSDDYLELEEYFTKTNAEEIKKIMRENK